MRQSHVWQLVLIGGISVMAIAGTTLWHSLGMPGLGADAEQVVIFDDANLHLPADLAGATGRIRVVHFWDPACLGCNRETGAHLAHLTHAYQQASVDFYHVRRPGTVGELPAFLKGRLRPLEGIEGMARIPASPAVAIWDGEGRLAYAGPYSLGMVCTSANSFVEPMLEKLVRGEVVEPAGLLAVGCYCRW